MRINFRGDSLQGANYDNIDNHGVGDAYDTLPGFLAPTRSNPGWPQAVRNFQRLNYNTVRIHQLPASPYMLDVADELGLMIQDETAIRGSNDRENFEAGRGRENMVDHLADLVLRDRNHASVLRWSQANEPEMDIFDLIGVVGANPGAGPEFDELLYQTVKALDPTRPISTDGDSKDLPQHDDYTVFCHYKSDQGQFAVGQYTENVCDVPGKPNGQGEFLWNVDHTPQGFTWFATSGLRMREKGAEDTRPYTLLNAWSSVIPGVERTDFSSIERGYPNGPLPLYGEDNLPDPWKNEQIQLLQKAFNPVAAVDTGFWDQNKLSDETGQWPLAPTTVAPGPVTRTLTVFNDTLAGERVNLTWKLHSGTPDGRVLTRGTVRADHPPRNLRAGARRLPGAGRCGPVVPGARRQEARPGHPVPRHEHHLPGPVAPMRGAGQVAFDGRPAPLRHVGSGQGRRYTAKGASGCRPVRPSMSPARRISPADASPRRRMTARDAWLCTSVNAITGVPGSCSSAQPSAARPISVA